MTRQMLLFGAVQQEDVVDNEIAASELRILGWNIQSPSLDRAKKQLKWLIETKANIIILTEVKNNEGSLYLVNQLEHAGFDVFISLPENNEYSAALCVKGFECKHWKIELKTLPHRFMSIVIKTFLGKIHLFGMYPPSFWGGESLEKKNKRHEFHHHAMDMLKTLFQTYQLKNFILGGDLNALEPGHKPHIPSFEDYYFYESFLNLNLVDPYRKLHPQAEEHSWFDRNYVGQRLDHFFISRDLLGSVSQCNYEHKPRLSRLSDHSAMWLIIRHQNSQ